MADSYVDAVLEDVRDKMVKAVEHTRNEFGGMYPIPPDA